MTDFLVYDIETAKNEECLWEPPDDGEDHFPPVPAHKIVAIGGVLFGFDRDKTYVDYIKAFGRKDATERDMLEDFYQSFYKSRATLITYNGRRFDDIVVKHRMMRHGMKAPLLFKKDVRYRYTEEGHLDVADQLTEYGAAYQSKLMYECQAIGMPGKVGVDGSEVQTLYNEGRIDDINSYAQCDVIQEGILALRWMHLRGYVSDNIYNSAVNTIIDVALGKNDAMITELIGMFDMNVLLLPARSPEEVAMERDDQMELPI